MAITVTFSLTDGGPAISQPLDFGNHGQGVDYGATFPLHGVPTVYQVFVRHNGILSISDCRLYLAPYSGAFTGINTPEDNYQELITDLARYSSFSPLADGVGGGAGIVSGFSGDFDPLDGVQLNVDSENDFPDASYTPITSLYGSSLTTAVDLGTIPPGVATGISFKVLFFAPSYGTSFNSTVFTAVTGVRQWDLKMAFTSRE